MAEHTVYCEECVEDIPGNEVYWDDDRLYCRRCGSELETSDADIFEQITRNRSWYLFRGETDEREEDEDENEVGASEEEDFPAEEPEEAMNE